MATIRMQEEEVQTRPRSGTGRGTLIAKLLLASGIIAGSYYGYQAYRHSQQYETTDNAQIEGNSAPVLARVAGYVQSVDVQDYATVRAGQSLLIIDPKEYDVTLSQTLADLKTAQADLKTAQADWQGALANARTVAQNQRVAESNAGVQAARRDKARLDLRRDQNLFKDQSLTQKQLEDTRNAADVQTRLYETNVEQIRLARTSNGVAQAGIAKALANIARIRAAIDVKQAAVDNARLRLGYARVTAPIGGKIGKKNIVTGQYVQPGQNLMTIADNSTCWVVANFKETQLEKMRLGQPVEIKLDAYPNLVVRGRLASLAESTGAKSALLPPDNASGNFVKITQRLPVRIEILNPENYREQLRIGLSVEAAVRVAD